MTIGLVAACLLVEIELRALGYSTCKRLMPVLLGHEPENSLASLHLFCNYTGLSVYRI